MNQSHDKLPITAIIAAKNEEMNLCRCLAALSPVQRVIVVDSHSEDASARISAEMGAEVVQFRYPGGYPKKRQWALDTLHFNTEWVLLIDADEVVPRELWDEIGDVIRGPIKADAYFISKGFHFLGKRFRFGGFSHSAVLLFRNGKARFEHLVNEPAEAQDMEVHERLIVRGRTGKLRTPLIHQDFKGLEAYMEKHNRYSTWEARVRRMVLENKTGIGETITPKLFGNVQERRRFLKTLVIRMPFEPCLWFTYHYLLRLGFLEGKRGLIACKIRSGYINQVRMKMFEQTLNNP